MNKNFHIASLALLALLASLAFPQAAAPKPKVKKITLANGLRVLLYERHHMPGVAFRTFFRIGSVDEEMGQTGLAHMFEHMAFKGTKTLNTKNYKEEKKVLEEIEIWALKLNRARSEGANSEKLAEINKKITELEKKAEQYQVSDEYEDIYQKNGSWGFNAGTSKDWTGYMVSLPSNRIDVWFQLEEDRFKNGVMREFYRERNVVQEERRMRESSPAGRLYETFMANSFVVSPYRRNIIGWMTDLERITATQAKEFYRTRYVPSRTIIAIVGDFNIAEVEAKIKKHFADIPAGKPAIEFSGDEPEQHGERRVELVWEAEPVLMMGWHKPNAPHPDDMKLALLSGVLDQGRTSRFYKNLVEKQGLSNDIGAYYDHPGARYPNMFLIYGEPRAPHSAIELEVAVEEQIDLIKKTPPEKWELDKVRNSMEVHILGTLVTNEGFAQTMAINETLYNDWSYTWTMLKEFESITPKDLSEVARKYLVRTNKTTGFLTKKEKS